MSSILLSGVCYAWDNVPVLRDVDLHLGPGWTGVVGANGAGKSTLLGLIAGDLAPDAGTRRVEGCAVRATQEDRLDQAQALAEDWQAAAVRWRARLGLEPDDVQRWSTLSPGERRRWTVGAALASEADVLLLDEPTNHLDVDAREVLVRALRSWSGTGLLVSHDRALLDAVTTRTVRVHRGGVRTYEGAYSAAHAQWELEAQQATQALTEAQASRAAAQRRLADARRTRDATTVSTGRRGRLRNAHDSDARTLGAATRAAWAETGAGRQVEVVRREVERLDEVVAASAIEPTFGRTVFVDYQRSPKARVLAYAGPVLAGERVLAEVDVQLRRDDHVRLAGPNGAGKTSLLHLLLGEADRDDVLFLPQTLTAEDGYADLDRLHALHGEAKGRVLQLVAALGVDPGALLATHRPSPGEARKLRLALGLGRQVAALVLDEPTNDLDLPAVERLEQTLAAWPGALLLVTHDDRFAAACTGPVWRLEGGVLRVEGVG